MTIGRRSKSVLKTGSSFAALSVALALSGQAVASGLPSHGHFVSGQGSIGKANQSLTVKQSSTTGVIDWNSFSIGKHNGVTFNNGSGATLNRVTGGNLSAIAGQLHATGSLYIMNSAGVIVSGTGHIVTGGNFAATGGNISNTAFGEGERRFGAGTGNVVNKGSIVAGGSASLIGRNVASTGTIHASAVNLSATNNLTINGAVSASKAGGAGGAVTARGQTIVIGTSGVINASSSASGQKGGTISVVARGTTTVAGELNADGGQNGRGGFIETSGQQVHVADSARFSTLAQNGQAGTWLIDPQNFTIAPSGGDITGGTLSLELEGGNVSILSSSGTQSGQGDILVDDTIGWDQAHTLTLDAYRNIVFNSAVTVAGAGKLVLIDGDQGQDGTGNAAQGDLIFSGGNVAFTAAGNNDSTQLSINGQAYTLENDIAHLAKAIMGNGSGLYALANSYDAAGGTYSSSPIAAVFTGTFEGLGNAINNLRIVDNAGGNIGLFSEADSATLRDITLSDLTITALKNLDNSNIGGLVGLADNTNIDHVSVSGAISIGDADANQGPAVGGLAGDWALGSNISTSVSSGVSINAGANVKAGSLAGIISSGGSQTLTDSHATGDVLTGANGGAGGFAAQDGGATITNSYASGLTMVAGSGNVGGFIAFGNGTLSNDYATGNVFLGTGENASVGGFVGEFSGNIDQSWASGNVDVAGAASPFEIIFGGFVGSFEGGAITRSFATGNVTGGPIYDPIEGGFAGFVTSGTSISTSYATGAVANGNVSGGGQIGGFVGYGQGAISRSYETGAVSVGSGSVEVGGFIGENDSSATIDQSYSYGKVTGGSGTIDGGFAGFNNNTAGLGTTVIDYYNKTANTQGAIGSDMSTTSSVGGRTSAQMFTTNSYSSSWKFGTSAGGTGWVIVDSDGSFNNASGAAGGTLPMLESEYSTTITSAHQLQLVGLDISADYTLANTIDASGTAGGDVWGSGGFVHIGTSAQYFAGTFDGQGNAIINLTQRNTPDAFGGVFANVDFSGTVENLGLVNELIDNSAISGGADGGMIAGFNNGLLSGDYTTGKVMAGSSGYSGGLVGNNSGTVMNSWSSATVSGTSGVAAGGLTGDNNGTIENAYAIGNVAVTIGGSSFAGGLAGVNNGTIVEAYSSGAVTAAAGTTVGGFIGSNSSSIGLSYFNKTANGSTPGVGSGSSTGVVGRTATQLMSASTFAHWTFGGLGSGADWVIVDADGSLNNSGGATGGTMPMLLDEYSTSINDAHQLQLMQLDPAATYTLANDIDASGTAGGDVWGAGGFIAVGGNNNPLDGFSGSLAGGGHTISSLTIADTTNADVGLFGVIDPNGNVSDVTLASASIHSTASVGTGGLAGDNLGTISNVTVGGAVSGVGNRTGAASVGGIAGDNAGTIASTQSSATVAATHDGSGAGAGGLVGMANPGSVIEESFATGAVSMQGDDVAAGGLVGLNGGSIAQSFASGAVNVTDALTNSANSAGGLVGTNDVGTITQSYALGNVTASGGASSLVGGFAGANSGSITQSFSLGSASGAIAAGFVGFEDNGTVSHSYWDTQTSGQSAGTGMVTGSAPGSLLGRTTAQLEAALPSGFDDSVWNIVSGTSLPYLNWQFLSGQPQVVSGTVLNGINGTAVANSIVSLLEDGASLDSVLTGGSVRSYANGFYYFLLPANSIGASSNAGVIVYDTTLGAATFDDQASASVAGLDLSAGYFSETTSQSTLSSLNADFAQALNSNSTVGSFIGGLANLEIGSAGDFDIDQAIQRSGTVIIDGANGAVNQSSAITASSLLLEGDANFTLNANANSFLTLAMSGTGSLEVTDNRTLTIGTVAGVAGVGAGGGVALETRHGNIKITQLLEAADHDMTLTSASAIAESGAGAIDADTLSGASHGVVNLNGNNVITGLGAFTTGNKSFAFTNAGALTVDGQIDAGVGALSLTTTKGGIVIDADLDGGNMTFNSASTITEGAVTIDARTLSGSSKGGAAFAGDNAVASLGTFTTNGDGNFTLDDSGDLIVRGNVQTGTHNINITTGGDLTIRRQLANSGTTNLVSGGTAREGAHGKIVTGKLNVSAQTGIVLEGNNQIQKLGTDTTASGPNRIKGVD